MNHSFNTIFIISLVSIGLISLFCLYLFRSLEKDFHELSKMALSLMKRISLIEKQKKEEEIGGFMAPNTKKKLYRAYDPSQDPEKELLGEAERQFK